MKTRREFLSNGIIGAATTWCLPAFLQSTMHGLHAGAIERGLANTTGKDNPILVVVQLGGGNDGLNTIIPHSDDNYHRARPKIKIAGDKILKVTEEFGFHPSMARMRALYDDGNLAVLNGIGYPNPNRSHFRSMEIWHTASDADKSSKHGWLGKYFDNNCSGEDPVVGIHLGNQNPQAFWSESSKGVSFTNPNQFKPNQPEGMMMMDDDGDPSMSEQGGEESDGYPDNNSGDSISMLANGSKQTPGVDLLGFLKKTSLDAQISSDLVQKIVAKSPASEGYPGSKFARDLQLVARMILGDMPTRVYYVNHGGFDTHANQAATHERLLLELSEGMGTFCSDLKKHGVFDRVVVMAFSEFGRRVAENGSGGTDHGAAGPLFMAGGKIKAGIHGAYPSLTDLNRGDLKFHTDFRQVYTTVLKEWLQVDSAKILGKNFDALPIFV